jgi:hypothetical protein
LSKFIILIPHDEGLDGAHLKGYETHSAFRGRMVPEIQSSKRVMM